MELRPPAFAAGVDSENDTSSVKTAHLRDNTGLNIPLGDPQFGRPDTYHNCRSPVPNDLCSGRPKDEQRSNEYQVMKLQDSIDQRFPDERSHHTHPPGPRDNRFAGSPYYHGDRPDHYGNGRGSPSEPWQHGRGDVWEDRERWRRNEGLEQAGRPYLLGMY